MPTLDTPQHLSVPIHAPQRAHIPSQALAQSPQYFRSDLFDRGRFRQDLRDRVLHVEAFLCALAFGDVLHGAADLAVRSVSPTNHSTVDVDNAVLTVRTPNPDFNGHRLPAG